MLPPVTGQGYSEKEWDEIYKRMVDKEVGLAGEESDHNDADGRPAQCDTTDRVRTVEPAKQLIGANSFQLRGRSGRKDLKGKDQPRLARH